MRRAIVAGHGFGFLRLIQEGTCNLDGEVEPVLN